MNTAQSAIARSPQPSPPPPPPPLSSALADVAAALQESTALHLEAMQERIIVRAQRAGARMLAWIGCGVSVLMAWAAMQASGAIWLLHHHGAVVAALSIAACNIVSAAVFFALTRVPSREDERAP